MSELFLSYCSRDNIKPNVPGDHLGWVEFFYEYLQNGLVGRGCGDLPVWRDIEKLRGNTNTREALAKALRDARLLIAVMSPNYFNSKWCTGEIRAFYKNVEAGNSNPDESIFRVFAYRVGDEHWPEGLDCLDVNRGYRFFTEANERVKRFYEYGKMLNEQAYLEVMDNLVSDIEAKLALPKVTTTPAAVELRPQVFLTASDEDTEEFALKLRAELRRRGIIVSCPPASANGLPVDQMKKSLHECLLGCKLSVHMIGLHPGPAVDGASLAAFQLRFAAEEGIRRRIWVRPEVWSEVKQATGRPTEDRGSSSSENQKSLDPEHAAFLSTLDEGSGLAAEDDLIRERFEVLQDAVVGFLQRSDAGS